VEIYKISEVVPGEHFMISVPCLFRFDLGSRLEIRRSLDEDTVSDHLEISNAISDALSIPEVSGNSNLSTFAAFFDDSLLGQFMTDEGFDLGRYIQSVYIARTVRYENGTEPLLGSLNLARNRSTLLQWIRSSVGPQEIAEGKETSECLLAGTSDTFSGLGLIESARSQIRSIACSEGRKMTMKTKIWSVKNRGRSRD